MGMKQFSELYRKKDGGHVLKQYRRAHVLSFALFQTLLQGFSKKSLEIVRLSVQNKIVKKLRKKYRKTIESLRKTIDGEYDALPHQRGDRIWFCWFQGLEHAPEIVKNCFASLQENIPQREIIVITEENFREYVDFPAYILEKYQKGIITRTHFSDLLRLQLLLRYGGTWVDATVFCSGRNIPDYMLNSDLFLFQNLKPGLDGHAACISSWFITSCQNHKLLRLTRDLLFEYWKRKKYSVDYFIVHDMFQLAIETYPREWNKVIPFSNSVPHILLLRLFESYDPSIWEATRAMTPFHKLTYKMSEQDALKKDTYYQKILLKI